MFKFFDQIGDSIAAVFSFVVNLFKNLIEFFKIIGSSLSFVVEVAAILPTPIKAGILCMIGVAVIYLVIGRE